MLRFCSLALSVILSLPKDAFAGVIDLPQTGQTKCYDTAGNEIACAGTGQDGDWQAGFPWPNPRFTDNGDGTVTDNLTGLVWLKDANCFGARTWATSLTYANTLNSGECGLSDGSVEGDWRLPNRKELRSLIDYSQYEPPLPSGHPFTNVQQNSYWSSTSLLASSAWAVSMLRGEVLMYTKDVNFYFYYVWPVRAGTFGYYCDNDSDGYINMSADGICRGSGCVPAGCQTTAGNDCNDNDPLVNPGATEVCNGIDNNCDGSVDEGLTIDADSDGYSTPASCGGTKNDCNDSNAAVNPGAPDSVCNGIDNDCDGTPDDGYVPTPTSCGQGVYASTGQLVCVNGSIQDTCNPGQPGTEGPPGDATCSDSVDNDCDGYTDANDHPDCD